MVVAAIVVMTSLSIPAFNAIRSETDFTSEVYDVAGMLNQARSYAVANDTYVLAGIVEVSGAQDSSASPQVTGTGRIAMATIASKSGTRPYQSLLGTGSLASWGTSGYGTGGAFQAVTNLMVLQNIHLVDLRNSALLPAQSGNMARPTVSAYYNLSNANGTASTQFAWPPGIEISSTNPQPQYIFARVIEFDPQGSARIISASNPPSYPDAVPSFIEIGLQSAHGAIAAGPPSNQSAGAGEIAAIQITGVSGANQTYKP